MSIKNSHKNWRPVGPFPSIAAAARKTGINYSTLVGRLRRGWSDDEALNVPVGPNPYRNAKKWPFYKTAWQKEQSKATELRAAGLTYREIAEIIGCSTSKVRDLLTRKVPAYS